MDTDETPRRLGRESVWVIAMTLLGAGVRLKGLGALGLDHFDEGIYAQAATWVLAEGGLRSIDPGLIPYAPPGYPVLVGLAYALIGPSGTAAILASILAGVLTIPVLAAIARRTFGRGAGAATASLVALAGPHVVFSRTGLTDATFLLAWSLAMLTGASFLDRPGAWRAARLGLLVGLAQLVKYNGWMAGMIVAVAVGLGAIRPGEGRRSARRALTLGLLAAAVAPVVYLPWFLFVERTTGYAGLLAHHRSYVDGPAGWWPNWQQQMAQAGAIVGVLAVGITWLGAALAMAWIGAAIGQGRSPRAWGKLRNLGLPIVLLLGIASLAAPANLAWWAALAWSPRLAIDRRAGARLVAAWSLVMAASTPLYHPYARLWLPTLAACWVATGGLVATLLARLRGVPAGVEEGEAAPRCRPPPEAIASIAAVVLAVIGPSLLPGRVDPFPSVLTRSDGVRGAARRFLRDVPRTRARPIHVYARPALRFYLAAEGVGPIVIHDDLESLRSASPAPGAIALIDAGQGVMGHDVVELVEHSGWDALDRSIVPASIPTLLDVRPGCVYDRSARHLGRDPSPLAGGDFPSRDVAGTCVFWTLSDP